MKFQLKLQLALVAGLLSSSAAMASVIAYTGATTVADPTWNRTVSGTPPVAPPSGVGTAVSYDVQTVTVSAAGTYRFQSAATNAPGWDNFTVLYQNSFNPLAQFTNVLVANDDNPSIGLSGFSASLAPLTTYFLVTTGFANSDRGNYTNTISGPGDIALGTPSAGGTVFTGELTATDSVWNRPVANGNSPPIPPASGVGTAVRFDVQPFFVSADGLYMFQSAATNPAGWDNYTFLYEETFDPLAPFVNVLIGNDDNPSIGLSGFSRNLVTGRNYFLVTTGFANSDGGEYTNTILGPGDVTLGTIPTNVPEPSVLALAGLALSCLVAARRRKRA